jgi:hypothetical protein
MIEIEYPDLLAISVGSSGFEAKPGIQFAAQISSTRSGEIGYAMVVLQNAFNIEVEGKISIEIPQRAGLFKKTYLSTISPVGFRLKGAEVKAITIPIRTTLETPEGEYDLKMEVKGKLLGRGERIRGKKEKTIGRSLGKSAALSAGVSAILLPIVGGFALYSVSNTLKGKFIVNGRAEKAVLSPLKTREKIIFGKEDMEAYETAFSWLQATVEMLKKPEAMVFFAGSIEHWTRDLFQDEEVKLSSIEAKWIARYLAIQILSLVPTLIQTIAFQVGNKIKQGALKSKNLKQEMTSLFKNAIRPWTENLSEDQRIKFLALGAAMASYSIQSRMFNKKIDIIEYAKQIEYIWKEGYEKQTSEGDLQLAMLEFEWPIILDAVRCAPTLFPDREERLQNLDAILKVFESYLTLETKGKSKEIETVFRIATKIIRLAIDEEKKE